MNNLSDFIERYIKRMLEEHSFVNVQRSDLAERFRCVPSQINYVLSTRFTIDQGFIVESRRGGGGYIKITKIPISGINTEVKSVINLIGDTISQQRAEGLVTRLYEEGLLGKRDLFLIFAAIHQSNFPLPGPTRETIRALILKAMLKAALRIE